MVGLKGGGGGARKTKRRGTSASALPVGRGTARAQARSPTRAEQAILPLQAGALIRAPPGRVLCGPQHPADSNLHALLPPLLTLSCAATSFANPASNSRLSRARTTSSKGVSSDTPSRSQAASTGMGGGGEEGDGSPGDDDVAIGGRKGDGRAGCVRRRLVLVAAAGGRVARRVWRSSMVRCVCGVGGWGGAALENQKVEGVHLTQPLRRRRTFIPLSSPRVPLVFQPHAGRGFHTIAPPDHCTAWPAGPW